MFNLLKIIVMLVATILMLIATLICFPFAVKVSFCAKLDDVCANVDVKVGIIRLLRLNFFIKDGALYYDGTIFGRVNCFGGGKSNVKILEWQHVKLFVGAKPTQAGVVLVSSTNITSEIVRAVRRKVGCNVLLSATFCNKAFIEGKARFKVSLLSLLGVG